MYVPEVAETITYREIFGESPKEYAFHNRLKRLSREDVLLALGKLSKARDDYGRHDPSLSLRVISWLKGDRAKARARQFILQEHRAFIEPPILCTAAREALLHCTDRPSDNFDDHRDAHLLAHVLLAITDLFGQEGEFPENPTEEEQRDIMTHIWLRHSGPLHPQLRNAIPRYCRLFVDLPRIHPDLVNPGIDFDARLLSEINVTVPRYLAIAFAVLTRFMNFNIGQPNPDGWPLDVNYLSESNITLDEFRGAMSELGESADDLATRYRDEIDKGRGGLYDHFPLVWYPLCEIRPGMFSPIDYPSLGGRLVGSGSFWRLRNFFEEERSDFGATVGKLLEQHCMEVAEKALPPPTRVYREGKFEKRKHGVDLAIVEPGKGTLFIELGVDQPNVRNTVIAGDVASFDRDVKTYLIKRARQLDAKIIAAREGRLKFEDQTTDSLGTIYPVICLLDGWPIAPGARERIEAAFTAKGLLQMPDIGRVAVISVEEFELLCGAAEKHGVSLCDVLEGYAADEWPLRNALTERVGDQPMTTFLEQEWERVVRLLATELGLSGWPGGTA
jgi:hypothetical protein